MAWWEWWLPRWLQSWAEASCDAGVVPSAGAMGTYKNPTHCDLRRALYIFLVTFPSPGVSVHGQWCLPSEGLHCQQQHNIYSIISPSDSDVDHLKVSIANNTLKNLWAWRARLANLLFLWVTTFGALASLYRKIPVVRTMVFWCVFLPQSLCLRRHKHDCTWHPDDRHQLQVQNKDGVPLCSTEFGIVLEK